MWLLIMRIEWRGRNVSSLGVASKQCMMASKAGMGSSSPNKSSMSIKSSCGVVQWVQCRAEVYCEMGSDM